MTKGANLENTPRRGINAVEVGMQLLSVLAAGDGPMMLKDIAASARLAPAKAHRYLASFVHAGMVAQAGRAGRYDLGPLALRLGIAALARQDVMARAQTGLADLRDKIRATCFLSRWSDRGPIIVAWEDSLRPLTVNVRVGSLMPLLRSATGRVFLAYAPDADIAAMRAAACATDGVGPDYAENLAAATRRAGLGRVAGDLQEGIDALAAPLFDAAGRLQGCVTALGPAGTFDAAPDGPVARELKAFAAPITEQLASASQGH